ncbi:hypothetical protein LV89_02965 [Arcicella aurantiaca]|uniref:GDSL-like lipase/acylhydrolase family protein n=1 Tax=Arcicella aurantiaca TaxID=591202 RepID=A0A316E4H4_9BACT|nr:hypothetical protein [Arcicella aurantiaca]PWK24452.1 hypothetical protein LV89_02965 [Arcicella aurantiaca]
MKLIRFFTKILLIAIVPLLAIDGLRKADLALDPRSGNAYLATFIDKMHLLDSVPSPRLILMSGSSMAFGVDSDLLSKELEIPVVNAALHFNLGSKFMMEQLKSTVKKGDIVLITLEYITTSQGQHEEQLIVSDFYPSAKKWVHFNSISNEIGAYTTHRLSDCRLLIGEFWAGTRSKPISIEDTTSVFFRKCFDKNGDLIGHLNNAQPTFINPELSTATDFSEQIKDLNDFATFAKQKGVTVLFTFPSYIEAGYEKNMAVVKKIENQYRTQLKFPILGSPENSVLDDSFFFDNVYHLNSQGRKIFTSRLIQLLEQEGV